MIRFTTFAAMLLLLFSCNNSTSTDKNSANETTAQPQQWFETDSLLVWDCNADDRTRKKIFSPKDSIYVAQAIINGINKTYSEVNLVLDHQSNDTIYISIPKADWLANKAGNSGAEQYLSFASLNLLETKGVNYVTYLFKGGAHAEPSTWTRTQFNNWATDSTSAQ
jgi:hypothetical protein